MELTARDQRFEFPRRPLVMGIVNINGDSFSGDGKVDAEWAIKRARDLASDGADIIDVGGESARTNRKAISVGEELDRIAPFIGRFPGLWNGLYPRDAVQIFPPLLSINTWRPEVAGPALDIGGGLLNDMGGLPDDTNARHCARTGAALLIMHSTAAPKIAQKHITYPDVMEELDAFFEAKIRSALNAGVAAPALVLDPGIDFAKQAPDNLRMLRECGRLGRFGRPVLLPVSRKGVIGRVLGIPDPRERDAGTAACIAAGMRGGASIFRVHNVELAWRVVNSLHRLHDVSAFP